MSWNKAKETAESHKGGGIFVRLENDKDKVVGVFCGEPHTRELLYDEKTNKYEPFTEAHAKAGKKSQPKFSLNFYVPAEDRMAVLEVGIVTFKDILKAMEKYGTTGDGAKTVFKSALEIERHGAKGNKKTTYSVLFEALVDDEMRAKIAKCELHDLARIVDKNEADDESTDMNSHDKKADEKKADAPKTNGAAKPEAPKAAEPMSADDITALAKRMKERPKADIDKFLTRFGIQKFKDLKASDKAAATAFVDELEGKKAEPAPAEDDPFA